MVIKTIVLEDERRQPLICLQHGDREVSTKPGTDDWLQDHHPCAPEVANRHTGYLVGGTSPFGTRKPIPIYLQESIAAPAPRLHQRRQSGFLVGITADDLYVYRKPTLVDAAA